MTSSVTMALILLTGIASAQTYTYTTIDPPGSTGTVVTGMNNSGQLAGNYTDASGTIHNFLRSADGLAYATINLNGAQPGATTIDAINNVGQMTGTYATPAGVTHSYVGRTDGSSFTSFDIPDLGPSGRPTALNDNGEVSGITLLLGASIGKGFLRKADGSFTPIVMTGYGFDTRIDVFGLNNNDQIVGRYFSGGAIDPVYHGFLQDPSGAITPFDLPGTSSGTVIGAINNHGQIAGNLQAGTSFVSIADGSFPILSFPGGTFTYATSIDDNGRVAGYYTVGPTFHGFLAVPSTGNSQPAIRTSPPGVISALAFAGSSTIAPGTWIEIYGEALSSNTRQWAAADFTGNVAPLSLDSVSVTIGGVPAYVSYISPGQVNALVPASAPPGTVAVVVSNGSKSSAAFSVTVVPVQPSLLVLQLISQGDRYLAAVFPDFVTYVLPPGYTVAVPTRRAQPGDTMVLFGMGLGPVTPNVPAGQIAPPGTTMQINPVVSFNATPAIVTYAGLVPGTVGLYQINVVVPNIAMPAGQTHNDFVSVTVQVNGVSLPYRPQLLTAVGQ